VRSLFVAAIASLAALIVGLAPATNGYAAPSAQDVQKQIDQLWNQLEPLIEQYNGVHVQLQQNLAKQADLNRKLQPLQMQVDLSMTRVGAISSRLYMSGPGSKVATLLETGSPSAFVEQLSVINHLAKDQRDTLIEVNKQVKQYNAQKIPLDALIAQQRKQDADLSVKKTQIQGQLAALQKLYQQVGASSVGGSLRPVPCPQEYIGGSAGKAINFACNVIGKPYVWATAGPSTYDCSGLTLAAWAAAGVSLNHYTVDQRRETTSVSRANLRPGDLVFYFGSSSPSHVAIYVGNGWVVHAPHPGDKVRMAKMDVIASPSGFGRPG
jgi:cell wall-associated NlpC family hydrolase